VNVTVTEPLAPGYITAWACGDDQPFTSNVNYQPWQTITNTAIVAGDTLCVYAHADTHLVVDVNVAYRNGSA